MILSVFLDVLVVREYRVVIGGGEYRLVIGGGEDMVEETRAS